MTVHYRDDDVTVYHGDCLDILATLPDDSVDAVVTDPPYGLEFMGKEWDRFGRDTGNGYREKPRMTSDHMGKGFNQLPNHFEAGRPFQIWCQQWATECLRVLKPGGHMAAFGGTRTWHRLAVAIEDAGFEIRDNLAWLYGSGFPKSLDVSKAIDKAAGAEREVVGARGEQFTATSPATDAAKQWQGWGTALKPAFEPIVLARKPIRGTVAANVVEHGCGALNIASCRVGTDERIQSCASSSIPFAEGDDYELGTGRAYRSGGRWPANVLLDPDTAAELDKQSGVSVSNVRRSEDRDEPAATFALGRNGITPRGHDDQGGASRFFPVFRYTAKAPGSERPTADGVSHPTVKPLELMRWLVRLITPPGGVVLDPFAGTGTTAEAAIHEHKKAIVIERESTYLPLIVARLHKPIAVGFNFDDDELW